MKINQKIILSIVSSILAVACLVCGIWLNVNSTHTQITKDKVVSEYEETVADDTGSAENTDSEKEDTDDIEDSVSDTDVQGSENGDDEADNTSDNNELTKPVSKTYYVSSSKGNDKNDGLSASKPLKTIAKVNKLDLNDGDKVLFKCGDLWRGEVLEGANAYVTYSSYGRGEKPTFYGSYENYTGEQKWLPTKYDNVYVLYKKIGDVGTFFFNNNKLWAVKKTKTTPDKLKNDLEFCVDYGTKEVFLYSAKGNPGKVYSSIEATVALRLIYLQTGNTVENLKLMYANYGVQCWTGNDVTVRNMDIHWMGGCGDEVRAGNAIEFWSNLDNIVIENNVISQCYDTGITCQYQGNDSKDIVMENIFVRNNKVSNCFWSTEFWLYMHGTATGHFRNLQITKNIFEKSGDCWSYDQRSMPNDPLFPWHIHLQAYDNYGDREILIENNIIDSGRGGLIYSGRSNYVPTLKGNTYIQKEGNSLGLIRGKIYAFDDLGMVVIKSLDKKATVKYAE